MAKTYLSIVNELLVEINEPELTGVASAVGVQKQVTKCVNRAYFDIVDAVDNWAWLATNSPQNEYYGNTYIETVSGTRWYLLKAGSANVDSDYEPYREGVTNDMGKVSFSYNNVGSYDISTPS